MVSQILAATHNVEGWLLSECVDGLVEILDNHGMLDGAKLPSRYPIDRGMRSCVYFLSKPLLASGYI
jgi:hypothetical protein